MQPGVTFQMGMGGAMMSGDGSQGMMSFTIDGNGFDAARVDQKVAVAPSRSGPCAPTARWTIRSTYASGRCS